MGEECYTGSDNIQFNPDWSYYEKNPTVAPEVQEEKAADDGKKLPETEVEVEQEEKKERLPMPDESELTDKMRTTAQKIQRIEHGFKSPQAQFDPNPAKEHAAKELIRDREATNQASLKEKRTLEEETYNVYAKTQQIEQEIRKTKEQGAANLKRIAKAAFNTGNRQAKQAGQLAFKEKKEEMDKEFAKDAKETGGAGISLAAKALRKAQEKREKAASLKAFKAKDRAAEIRTRGPSME